MTYPDGRTRQFSVRRVAEIADLAFCGVVLTSLPDDVALAAVALGVGGLVAALAPRAVHISMSTVSPGTSPRVADAHAGRKQDYVAAPVLGIPDFAHERKRFVLAARSRADSHVHKKYSGKIVEGRFIPAGMAVLTR